MGRCSEKMKPQRRGRFLGTNQLRGRPFKWEMGREQCELWLEPQCVVKGIEKTGLARAHARAPVGSDEGLQEELGRFRKACESKTHGKKNTN